MIRRRFVKCAEYDLTVKSGDFRHEIEVDYSIHEGDFRHKGG